MNQILGEKIKVVSVGQTPPPFMGQAISFQNIVQQKSRTLEISEEIMKTIYKEHINKKENYEKLLWCIRGFDLFRAPEKFHHAELLVG